MALTGATGTGSGPPGQPNIAYTPDWETYQLRVKRSQERGRSAQELPDGFPQKLQSSLAWDGATVSEHYQWSYELNETDLAEIQNALEHFKRKTYP